MKKLFFFLMACVLFFVSCSNDSNLAPEMNPEDDSGPKSEKKTVYEAPYLIEGQLKNIKWYVTDTDAKLEYYIVYDNGIVHTNLDRTTGISQGGSATITFLTDDCSEFTYKWKNKISVYKTKVLVVDADVLILEESFVSGSPIYFKNLESYMTDIPYKGIGEMGKNDQWLVFTPSGKCYKRYLNIEKNEKLVAQGTWEKIEDKTYKIYWKSENKTQFDILKNMNYYQGISENEDSVPISITVVK